MPTTVTVKLPGQPPVSTADAVEAVVAAAALTEQELAAKKKKKGMNMPGMSSNTTEYAAQDARWEGELGFETQFTGDGRFINKGALRWDADQLPMPLRWAPTDVGAHGGAMVVGLIETLQMFDGKVMATGIIDLTSEHGQKVYAGLQNGTIKGVSLDLDDVDMELRVKKEIYDEFQALFDDNAEETPALEPDAEGYVKVGEFASDDEVIYVTDARIRAATLVDIPAFASAYVALVDANAEYFTAEVLSLAASAPVAPPAAWFDNPGLREATPLTFTDDGRVFGHIALWKSCHLSFSGTCVTPPSSATNYAWFRTGSLITSEGTQVPVGHITLDTGHAPNHLTAAPAAAHYDNTGCGAADVAAGEDSHGIWVSGALRPSVDEEQLRVLRSSPMSGDWRHVGGQLELIGILAVNIPGFPVPRTRALVASGRTATLWNPIEVTDQAPSEPTALEIFASESTKLRHAQWAELVQEG